MEHKKLILASASPRRQELIKLITDDFEIAVSQVEETIPDGMTAEDIPQYLAMLKAKDISKKFSENIVIGADTCIIADGIVLGKPKTKEDAASMLKSLSGNTHYVITGCALVLGEKSLSFSVTTEVEFYPLTDKEIENYIDSGEPFDKAGAYGIQGKGSLFVKRINGDYFNVVGLPVAKLNKVLDSFLNFTK